MTSRSLRMAIVYLALTAPLAWTGCFLFSGRQSGNENASSNVNDNTAGSPADNRNDNVELPPLGNDNVAPAGNANANENASLDDNLNDNGTSVPPVAVLLSLGVNPANLEFTALGQKVQLLVTGRFSDGTTANLTADQDIRYTSTSRTIATVSRAGLVTGVGAGEAVVTIVHGAVGAQVGVTVLPVPVPSGVNSGDGGPTTSALINLSLSPSSAQFDEADQRVQLTVTGHYGDGTTADLTAPASGTVYTSDDLAVATVSATGLLAPIARGSAVVTATNGGLVASLAVDVTYCRPATPILDPHASSTATASILLTGEAEPNAQIEIVRNTSEPLLLGAGADGSFAAQIPLELNRRNQISVTTIADCGARSSPAIAFVTQDNQAPSLFIDVPLAGAEIEADISDVAGRVSDSLSGYSGLTVTVNGQSAIVDVGIGTNGTFFLPGGLTLSVGMPTTITVTAADALGNFVTQSVSATRREIPQNAPRMEIVRGNRQAAPIHQWLPEPIVVQIIRPTGSPFANKVVTFEVTRSDGRLASEATEAGSLIYQTFTDSDGLAQAYWHVGSDAGMGNNRVSITSRDIAGTIEFCASATPGPATQINIGNGNNQRIETGGLGTQPLRAWVSDSCNGLAGMPVMFTVTRGGGKVNGLDSVTVATSITGHAEVDFRAGPDAGNQDVEATFAGNPGLPAVFTIYGIARDENQPTTLSGLVMDNASRPIRGATCRLVVPGHDPLITLTDDQGQFHFPPPTTGLGTDPAPLPPGPVDLLIDGLTADGLCGFPTESNPSGCQSLTPASFPSLRYSIVLVPNAANALPSPVLLPPLDSDNAPVYAWNRTTDLELTCTGIEGLKMIVKAGTTIVTSDGRCVGPACPPEPGNPLRPGQLPLSLNQVHHDDVPMPMPDGAAPPFAWTLQPAGASFDPPVQVDYPNMTGLPAGAISFFLSFNHANGRFEIIATGSVSNDGSKIRTDPGAGISLSGWGCNCPPYSVTGSCCRESDLPDCTGPCGMEVAFRGATNQCCDEPCPRFSVRRRDSCDCDPVLCPLGVPILPESVLAALLLALEAEGYGLSDAIAAILGEYRQKGLYVGATEALRQSGAYGPRQSVEAELARNAHLHLWWQAELAARRGTTFAEIAGYYHEWEDRRSSNGYIPRDVDTAIDLYHNELARQFLASLPLESIYSAALQLALGFNHPSVPGRPILELDESAGVPKLYPEDEARIADLLQECAGSAAAAGLSRGMRDAGYRVISNPSMPILLVGEEITINLSLEDYGGQIISIPENSQVDYAIVGEHATVEQTSTSTFRGIEFGTTVYDVVVTSADFALTAVGRVTIVVGDVSDRDGDGIPGNVELAAGMSDVDPFDAMYDFDSDSLFNIDEFSLGTDIRRSDSDGDLRDDGDEVLLFRTSPSLLDTAITERTVISMGGASGRGERDGSFLFRNISLEDRVPADFIADYPIRVVAAGADATDTIWAFSEPFYLSNGNTATNVGELVVSTTPPPLPASIALEVCDGCSSVVGVGQDLQLTATATLNDGSQLDVTQQSQWTTYRCSNPAVATVGPNSLVTGHARGTVFITAANEGATAVKRIDVADHFTTTTVTGFVLREDGTPVPGAVVTALPNVGAGTSVVDGSFTFQVTYDAGPGTVLTISAMATLEGGTFIATAAGTVPVADGFTDAGLMILRATDCSNPEWAAGFNERGWPIALAGFDDGTGPALYAGGNFLSMGGTTAYGIAKWDGAAWSALEATGGNGISGEERSLAVFDDGTGAALYAGGYFSAAGGVPANSVAKWDGTTWSPLSGPTGDGVDGDGVLALAVFDDGSGPALYVGGSFMTAGGVVANNIAKWDGTAWSPLLGPTGTGVNSTVIALTVYDDGTGPALLVGGRFNMAGGVEANGIAKWDGTAWSALIGPLGNAVNYAYVAALAVYDDGAGPALYAGGFFNTAGGVTANNIARWNGTAWSALSGPTGEGVTNGDVSALAVFDDGLGPALYVGGNFILAGGVTASFVARWDGAVWSTLSGPSGVGTSSYVDSLAAFDNGAGPALFAGGLFDMAGGVDANRIARWDGTSWSALPGPNGDGVGGSVAALAVFGDAKGEAIYAGGDLDYAGGAVAGRTAKWNGTAWSPLVGPNGNGINGSVDALAVFDDGSGPALYAGGTFYVAGGVSAHGIARWDGSAWSALIGPTGEGVTNGYVNALTVFDDGLGPALYAGGFFTRAGDVPAFNIAKWDGATWAPLFDVSGSNGVGYTVNALLVFNDESGPALYAGGEFSSAGSLIANRIARWDGMAWSPLIGPSGNGVSNPPFGGSVNALAVFDDGFGPALYAGGRFTSAGGVAANSIAKWDGTAWSPLSGPSANGMDRQVDALAIFDNGTGPALYAGGVFDTAGGVAAYRIAQWDGMTWSPLTGPSGNGMVYSVDALDIYSSVYALAVFDDGSGPALYAGGLFFSAGGLPSSFIARWGCTP